MKVYVDGKQMTLEDAVSVRLQDADIAIGTRKAAQLNYLEAFSDDPGELKRLIEVYPKILLKFPLKPQLAFGTIAQSETTHLLNIGRLLAFLYRCR